MMMQEEHDELRRQFGRQQFCTVLVQLLQSMGIYKQLAPERIYEQIMKKNGRVIGKDVVDVMQQIQNDYGKEEEQLSEQIKFYHIKIKDFIRQGSKSISIEEFDDHFRKSNPHCGILTDEIYSKVCHFQFISIPKLETLIKKVSIMKDDRSTLLYLSGIQSLEKSNVAIEEDVPVSRIFDHLKEYIPSSVYDTMVQQNILKMIQLLQKNFQKLNDKYSEEVEIAKKLHQYRNELEEQLVSLQIVLDKKEKELKKIYQNYSKQNEELESHIQKQRQFLNIISTIQYKNDEITKERDQIILQNQQLQSTIEIFKSSYDGLAKQVDIMVSKSIQDEKREETESKKRLFIQRSTKQQLQEAHEKINRLRVENSQLQQKKFDIQAEYQAKVNSLQEKIKQLEEYQQPGHLSQKFQYSQTYQSRLQARKTLFESQVSHASFFKRVDSMIEDQGQEKTAMKLKQDQNRQEEITFNMKESSISSVLQAAAESSKTNAFKKKKNAIAQTISVIFPNDSEQHLNQYDQIGILTQNKDISELTAIIGSTLYEQGQKNTSLKQKMKGIFSASAYIQNESGSQFLIGLIVSRDRFTILDTKMRFQYSIKFSQIKKISFCHYNITWLALVIKPQMKNDKNQSLTDMVISLTNRSQLLDYLYKYCAQSLQQNGTAIKFQKQDDFWLRISGKDIQPSNFLTCFNLFRLSANNSHNIFQVNLKQGSSFFGSNVLFIVTSIGCLCFQKKNATNLIQEKPTLLYFIPLVQKMSVIDLSNQHKLKITYETEDKSYRIKTNSYALTKKLKRKIDEQRAQNFQWKIQLSYQYSQLVDMTKSRRK